MRRVLAALVVVFAVLSLAQRVEALPFVPDPCDLAPTDALKTACGLANPSTVVETTIGVVGGGVDTVTGGAASGIFGAALAWLSGILSDTVASAMDGLGAALTQAPSPPIDTEWFAREYAPLMVAGIGMCVFVLIFHLVANMVRFRTAEMGRAFVMFLAAVFLTAAAPLFIRMALQFADALTSAFASVGGDEAGQLTDKITEVTTSITQTGGLEAVKPLILILVLMVAVVLVIFWMILLTIRSLILYIGTLAIPFVLPSIIDGKARFARLYFRAMFGVIISAPILFGTLCFGAMLIRDGYVGDNGLWPLLAGICLVGVATFLPLFVFKLLLPATAPLVAVVERGGERVVSGVRSVGMIAAGALTGGAAGVAMASSVESTPRTPPPRPRGPS